MNEKAAAARRAYKRKWAKDHPDKVRAQQERYWAKKAAEKEKAKEAAEKEDRSGTDPEQEGN